jgi:predicted short-subunit dehydrogenase-like oxidoreductase (DUF2520 family)
MAGKIMTSKPKVIILGAGNVATHLAINLAPNCFIAQIYNHRLMSAKQLADRVGALTQAIDSLSALDTDADIYIISVKDDAVAEIANALKGFGGVWVHTSGSVPPQTLAPITDTYGVLYPMQTFSKNVDVDMSEVPIFVEGTDATTLSKIKEIAGLLSTHIYDSTPENRMRLHIAAVFACNFTNYLWAQSAEILKGIDLDFSIMQPLIKATLDKAITIDPEQGQTGPARRNDMTVINKHLSLLDGSKHDIYKTLSQYIIEKYHD